MYILDKERARKVLLNQGALAHQVDRLLQHYPPLDSGVGETIDQWLDDQTISDLVIEGISVQDVMEKRGCNFLVAIRDLAILLDPNLPSEKRMQWREILTTPVFYE